MSVHLDVEQDTGCVVTVSGDADLYAAANVERELVRLVDAGRRSIVVDLTEATFIDSTMLRVLLNVSKRLRPGGGELLVVCHDIPIRYALNAAAGSDQLDGPQHGIPNATPYLFDEEGLRFSQSLDEAGIADETVAVALYQATYNLEVAR